MNNIKVLGILLLLTLCSCTTLHSHSQRVKLFSEPEGATVLLEGKPIGRTPDYIEIPRQKNLTLTFEKKGYPLVTKTLERSYRWGDSFFADLIWLYGAPLGWIVDYASGTAWDYDKVGVITFPGSKGIGALNPPKLIAIAPPHYYSELLSNEAGSKLEIIAHKRFNNSEIKSYADTRYLFSAYDYSNDRKTPDKYIDDLYQELNISHLLESDLQTKDDYIIIHSRLIDAFTDEEVQNYTDRIPKKDFKYADVSYFGEALSFLTGLTPNTLSFDLGAPAVSLSMGTGQTFLGVAESTNSVLGILTGFGIKSLDSPKLSRGVNPVARIIPVLTLNYNTFYFSPTNQSNHWISGYNFQWATIGAGAGGELGLETTIGYFYVQFAPCLSMNWITATSGMMNTSSRGTDISILSEVGYQIFASSRINLRFFARSENMPRDPWTQILTQVSGSYQGLTSVNRTAGGLSIGYYFPEDRTFLKRTFFPY